MNSTITLAVIGGDGIGPEVTAEAVKALDVVAAVEGLTIDRTDVTLGAEHWKATGEVLPDDVLEDLRRHDLPTPPQHEIDGPPGHHVR